ncbi:MAG: fibronectin type III domain-containing protein [Patescibacteria group bacterium]
MKFRILFVVVLAVSSFVFISQVNAQISAPVAPNFQITGTGANCSLNLSWNDLINEDSYEIERSVDGVNFSLIASPGMNTTSWNNGVSPDISYSYRIRAINRVGASPWAMITSKPLFCRTYNLYGNGGGRRDYSQDIGEELLQQGASSNVITREGSPNIGSQWLSDNNNDNYFNLFNISIENRRCVGPGYTCEGIIPNPFPPPPSFVPYCRFFGEFAVSNACGSSSVCFNPCWPFRNCRRCAPVLLPELVDIPFLIQYSVQGFRAAYIDLKINNLDGLNLEVPNTQADASWVSENTILPCIAATLINGQPADNYGLSNLWNGSRQVSGSENLGVLERGQENAGQGRQYNFSITCNTVIGSLPTVSDRVNVGVWKFPIIDNFNCDSSIVPPQAANCALSVRNADQGCVISGGSFSDTVCSNESECLNDSILLRPSQTTTFTLTCSAIDGNRSNQRTISVSGGGGGVGGGGGGGGATGSSIWKFFKNIIWREVIPR